MVEFVRGTYGNDESDPILVEMSRGAHGIDVIAWKLVGYVRHTKTRPVAAQRGSQPGLSLR